ncbi:hypothetical protein GDO81_023047 [Engystomops pustulosus]|uniref:CCHC-type domain-containing protein n=1 Tax=Engystomops pustulosus TaxID=76066 RepID=A0AAV6YW93_ENGPU|nr:hypothetical protein GDO81_023047 [Engystomops pustulosus]
MQVGSVNVVGAGVGPVAPPVAAPIKSYASVAAGGSRGPSSSSLGSGDGFLQRRLLQALQKGERTINVAGQEVDLSFWIERHGLSAFREQRGRETSWSLPTTGPGANRRNVVRLRWRGSDVCPPRARVVELLLKMDFKAADIFALIHPHGTSEFDISFVRPEGLELFWSNYELRYNEPEWRDFAVQAVSRQSELKKVTVLTRNESLSCFDIMTWMNRYGEVLGVPEKNRDEYGIWSGAWTFMVKLRRSGQIRCNLCGDLGHPYSRCPLSFANAGSASADESHEAESAGEGPSRGGGMEGPGKKDRKKTPAQLRRLEKRQQERERGESRAAGTTSGALLETTPVAEAPGEDVLDEEVRRIEREEGATSSDSSHYESMDEDNRAWLEEKRKRGAKKKKKGKKKGGVRSSPSLTKVPKEGATDPPLVELSNRFLALDGAPPADGGAEGEGPEVAEPAGGAESPPGESGSSGGETGPESGDEDEGAGPGSAPEASEVREMDTTICLKRGCSFPEGGGKMGKKKAV